ncbi:MAG: PAS domain S-box protein [Bacteroidales bacterium]|nr:PAS domain S-box protein [Bacteroidales bacterium]
MDNKNIKDERYRLIAENAIDIIWASDMNMKPTYFSPSIKKILGYTVEEALQQKIEDVYTPASAQIMSKIFNEEMKKVAGGQKMIDQLMLELEIYHKDGHIIPIEVQYSLICNEKGQPYEILAIGRDISEWKKAELEIKKKNEELKKLNDTKDKFFSIIAHDLKSPFSNILGFCSLLSDDLAEDNFSNVKSYLAHICNSSNYCYRLLENLLDWALAQQGKIPFNPRQVNLNNIIRDVLYISQNLAKPKNIELINNISSQLNIFADIEMIKTIIRNLISNAIKFTDKGGRVELFCKSDDEYIYIYVKDNGIGINEELATKLLSNEISCSIPGTENEKGSGLGLLICNEFVNKHKGNLSFTSQPGFGSEFCISLPLN